MNLHSSRTTFLKHHQQQQQSQSVREQMSNNLVTNVFNMEHFGELSHRVVS